MSLEGVQKKSFLWYNSEITFSPKKLSETNTVTASRSNQHAPGRRLRFSGLLLVLVMALSVQLIGIVFAMGWTLFNSTTESHDTEQVIQADFDGDSDLDYIAFNEDASEDYDLYLNDGTGVYTSSVITKTGDNFIRAATGDIDNDGDMDFVTADDSGDDIYKYVNNGSGVFTETAVLTSLGNNASDIILADIDNDGDVDIVFISSAGNSSGVYINNGLGTFAVATATLPTRSTLAAADFDSDGDLDLLFGSSTTYTVFRNTGTGSFAQISTVTGTNAAVRFVTNDLDGDGDIDALATAGAGIEPLFNDGTGTLSTGTIFSTVNTVKEAAAGDLDNDGDFDAVLAGFDSGASNAGNETWLNNGNGVFTQTGTPTEETECANGIALGDIDNDGDVDYVVGNTGCSTGGQVNRHYKNDQAATSANTAPTAPSTGFGATFYSYKNYVTVIDSTSGTGSVPAIAIGADGFPVIVHHNASNNDLLFVKCNDINCVSKTSSTIANDTSPSGSIQPDVVIGSDNLPIVSFNANSTADLKVVKCGNAACSSGNTTTSVDTTGSVGSYDSIALGTDGFAVISYRDASNSDLKVAKCTNHACSSSTISTVDSTGNVGTYTSIAVPSDGLPVISYQDSANGTMKVAKCGNASCSASNTITTVDSNTNTGFETAIAVDEDGFPIISYQRIGVSDLYITKCTNADCSSGAVTTAVDTTGTVGAQSQVIVPPDGLPVAVYRDGTSDRLKLVKCGNASCSSGNTFTLIDSIAGGSYSDIVAGFGSLPLIVYSAGAPTTAKMIRCGNTACSAGGIEGNLTVKLAWGSGSDAHTSTRLLQYQVRIGTGSNANNIMSSETSSPNYVTHVMPNGQSKSMFLNVRRLCDSDVTYYWSVSAVDSGFKSTSSSEYSFVVEDDCSVTDNGLFGGGTSGGSTGGGISTGVGGGWRFRPVVSSTKKDDTTAEEALYPLKLSALNDLTGDGQQTGRETVMKLLKGLTIFVDGLSLGGQKIHVTTTLDANATAMLKLPKSDKKGYRVSFDTKSPLIADIIPTFFAHLPVTISGVIPGGANVKTTISLGSNGKTAFVIPSPIKTSPATAKIDKILEKERIAKAKLEEELKRKEASLDAALTKAKDQAKKAFDAVATVQASIEQSKTTVTTALTTLTSAKNILDTAKKTVAALQGNLKNARNSKQPQATIKNLTALVTDATKAEKKAVDTVVKAEKDLAQATKTLEKESLALSKPLAVLTQKEAAVKKAEAAIDTYTQKIAEKEATIARLQSEREALQVASITITVDPVKVPDPVTLQDLPVTVTGTSAADEPVSITAPISATGEVTLELPPSSDEGYVVSFPPVLAGIEVTGETETEAEAILAFRKEDLLEYKPCMLVGDALKTEKAGADPYILLQRLTDNFGSRAMRGITLSNDLISRADFLRLLQRTQCLDLYTDVSTLESKAQEGAKKLGIKLPLLDLSIDPKDPNSILVYSMIAQGGNVVRQTPTGFIADLQSPMTRADAITMLSSILPIPDDRRIVSGLGIQNLIDDLSFDAPIVPDFLTLWSIDVLPTTFSTIPGINQGIDLAEVTTLLSRAAFAGGKIDLLPPLAAGKSSSAMDLRAAATEPTFLSSLPTSFKIPACLERQTERPMNLSFTDLLPGDPAYADIREVLMRSTKNDQKQNLWLLPATSRLSEFGVEKGQTTIALQEPATLLETIRNLLVFTCNPPLSATQFRLGGSSLSLGTAETMVARDRISGLPRDSSFASRVLYRAQDHQRLYDLSLFTYAPHLLMNEETRSPNSPLSLKDGTDLIASALLNIAVSQKAVSPQEAENLFQDITVQMRQDLLGNDVDWQDEMLLRTQPLTRTMLVKLLATAILNRRSESVMVTTESATTSTALGEVWWERVTSAVAAPPKPKFESSASSVSASSSFSASSSSIPALSSAASSSSVSSSAASSTSTFLLTPSSSSSSSASAILTNPTTSASAATSARSLQ